MNASPNRYWCAVYTRPRAEQTVHTLLLKKGLEAYLPLYKELRIWSDRKKWIEVPLFRSYVFVRLDPFQSGLVLETQGVLNFVRFGSEVARVQESELDAIREFIKFPELTESTGQLFRTGDPVQVVRGVFRGIEGKLVYHKGKSRVAIEIESLGRTLLFEVPAGHLEAAGDARQVG